MKRSLFSALVFAVLCVFALAAVRTVEVKTDSYSVTGDDDTKVLVMNSGSAKTFALPALSSGDLGFEVTLVKAGAGNLTIQAPAGMTIADGAAAGTLVNSTAAETYAAVTLVYAPANKWRIIGGQGTWVTSASTRYFGTASTLLTAKADLASPTFTGTVTIPTPFTLGAVSVLPTGTELNFVDGVTSAVQTQLDTKIPNYKTADAALAADGVLVTTIPDTIAGIICVSEATALKQYFLIEAGAVATALATNAAYSVTKDNALTVNVYFETNVLKIQNKTAAAINVKVGVVGVN